MFNSAPFKAQQFRILVVEDSAINRTIITRALERAGYQVEVAETAQTAQQHVQHQTPDLILLDLMLPDRSGLEVCRWLRAEGILESTAVIFLTASNDHCVAAFAEGASDYITKPFKEAELLVRVKNQLQIQYLTRKLQDSLWQMSILATTDSLTQTLTRRQLFLMAYREIHRSQRQGSALAVLMVDVDFFKAVNDQYGHLRGDQVLQEVAAALRQTVRKVDLVGRYGGEEFMVVLVETDGALAQKVAEQVRKQVEQLEIAVEEQVLKVTVSIGIALYAPRPEGQPGGVSGQHSSQNSFQNNAQHSFQNNAQHSWPPAPSCSLLFPSAPEAPLALTPPPIALVPAPARPLSADAMPGASASASGFFLREDETSSIVVTVLEAVISRADQALYQAKARGRNCCYLLDEAEVT